MDASTDKPRRRVGRRVLIAVAGLILLAIAAVWLLPWLLMPEDLRRMQGRWKLMRIEWKKNPNEASEAEITIIGHRLREDGRYDDSWIEIDAAKHKLRMFTPEDNRRTVLGRAVNVPLWLSRPPTCAVFDYELHPKRLVLELRGTMDAATGIETELEERAWRKLYFERD